MRTEFDVYRSWVDFYSDEDWTCGRIPLAPQRHRSEPLHLEAGVWEKLTGQVHSLYFSDEQVARVMLGG